MKLVCFYERARIRWIEWHLGIRTESVISTKDLGFTDPNFRQYVALDYRVATQILSALSLMKNDWFVDFGCGMGRILALASRKAGHVIGVECSKELAKIAVRNLRQRRNVQIVNCDAAAFEIPPKVTTAFIFNSFGGYVLDSVLENIRTSLLLNPRPFRLACAFPMHFEFHMKIEKVDWLHPIWSQDYLNLRCVVFTCSPNKKFHLASLRVQ